jgi:hypothetical protein
VKDAAQPRLDGQFCAHARRRRRHRH